MLFRKPKQDLTAGVMEWMREENMRLMEEFKSGELQRSVERKEREARERDVCPTCWRRSYGLYPDDQSLAPTMLKAVNYARESHGVQALRLDDHLMSSAQWKADDMVNRNYYAHVTPDGDGPPCGENIAMGQKNMSEVFQGWRGSHGHHTNIVLPHYTRFGVGLRETRWVQHFA